MLLNEAKIQWPKQLIEFDIRQISNIRQAEIFPYKEIF